MNKNLIANNPPDANNGVKPDVAALFGSNAIVRPGAMIRVLIADDHPFVRSGIKQCINDSIGMSVVGEAGTARQIFEFLDHASCDVLVLDIGLPDQTGLEVLRILKKSHPALPVLILTMYPEDQFSRFCLRAGAAGFLSKSNASNHLVEAIRKVAGGGRSVSLAPGGKLMPDEGGVPPALPHQALSETEFLIFCQIACGNSRQTIAAGMGLSLKEVNAHRARILKIMKMAGNAEIVSYGITHQLIT